ncbi:glycosyltransferase family 4 protein [Sanguibacter suarezii]|uniref:glycosyltransferase family 4 protein n=1 Tax=Sanguibacter suarezii TaxID=60921 RepID=UPI0009FC3570|nr:glycosyltransferase family 4 protein [Sanguibacter suarezii]
MESTNLRIAVTTGPVRIPPTYFVINHLLHMDGVDGRVFSLSAQVDDPEVARLVEGATPYGVPGVRGSLAAFAAVRRQRAAVRAFAPDVVHQHFGTWSLAGSGAARDLGVPFIATLHGYDVFRRSDEVRNFWTWITARNLRTCGERATTLLAVSEWLAAEAVRRGYPADKVAVHYQGVDTDFFTPPVDPGTRDVPEVLFLGALEKRKGVTDAVEASVELARTTPHTLRVIGAGSLELRVRAAAAEHPHIRLEGMRDRAGVREAMRHADVFVLPTQQDGEWREAAGLVTLEAQACGVPVVVYASGGAPEMVEDGVTGVLVPERDTRALAGAVGDLLRLAPEDRRSMSRAARDFTVARRSLRASAAELQDRYASLTGRSRKDP